MALEQRYSDSEVGTVLQTAHWWLLVYHLQPRHKTTTTTQISLQYIQYGAPDKVAIKALYYVQRKHICQCSSFDFDHQCIYN